MSRKYKNNCPTLNYIEHFLILASASTGCISIFVFAFCAIAAAVKKYKPIIKQNSKYDKMVLLSRSKLNSIDS